MKKVCAGNFGKSAAKAAEEKENLSAQLALRAEPKGAADSHSSGFEVPHSPVSFLEVDLAQEVQAL